MMVTVSESRKTFAGSGYSVQEDSYKAGVEIVTTALSGQKIAEHTLFFIFATSEHDVEKLLEGARSVSGNSIAFFGCTSKGVVTKDFMSYNGIMAGGGFLSSDEEFFKLFFESSVKNREFEAGKGIAEKAKNASVPEDSAFILFYDSIKQTVEEGAPMLNIATPILEGFRSVYGFWPVVSGIGSFADLNFVNPCAVWAGNDISRFGLGAAAIAGSLKMHQLILRGTRPIGDYYTITKAEANVIYELNNRPALDVISEIMGDSVSWEDFPFFVTLGVNNGDKYAPYNEDNYFSRLCFAVDKENKSLIMFESDMGAGLEVQLMRRDIDLSYIRPRVDKLLGELGGRKPVFALYIDCIGRVSAFSGMQEEEAQEVARAIGDIPFFGIFSGVEIANVGADVKALDWTGVLCLFSEA